MVKAQLVFQAYGNERILEECLFALLTLAAQHRPEDLQQMQLHIYTDNTAWFDLQQIPLPVQYHGVDVALIRKWRGSIDFVHRVKVEVLKDIAQQVSGPVLYMDTDVCFLRPVDDLLTRIASGELFMHVMEGIIADRPNPVLRKLDNFLAAHPSLEVNGAALEVSRQTAMWNAGVLGMNEQYYKNSGDSVLDRVLAFTDTVYPMFSKHVVEQFAFSYFFQQKGQVHQAAPVLLHYWNFKEFRQYLASFFSHYSGRSWADKLHLSQMLQVPVLIQEKLNFYSNRSIAGKILGKHWQPQIPDWDMLAKQL